jgi:hypothetical protein
VTLRIELEPTLGTELVRDGTRILGHISRLDLCVGSRYAVLSAGGNHHQLVDTRRSLLAHGFSVNAQCDDLCGYGAYERRCHSPDMAMSTMLEQALHNPVMMVEHDNKTLETTWVVRWEPK